jgi:hypothetical protein
VDTKKERQLRRLNYDFVGKIKKISKNKTTLGFPYKVCITDFDKQSGAIVLEPLLITFEASFKVTSWGAFKIPKTSTGVSLSSPNET